MNKYSKIIVYINIICTPTFLYSGILDQISGSTGLEYQLNKMTSTTTKTKQSTMKKTLELGYIDYVYNPNLLIYTVQTKFKMEESENTSGETTTESTRNVSDYNVRLDILRVSKYPAILNISKNTSPITQVTSEGILETSLEREKFDIDGKIFFTDRTFINYILTHSTNDSATATGSNSIVDNNLRFKFNFVDFFINTGYSNSESSSLDTEGIIKRETNLHSLEIQKNFGNISVNTKFDNSLIESSKNYGTFNNDKNEINTISTDLSTNNLSLEVEYITNNMSNSVETTSDEQETDLYTRFNLKVSEKININNSFNVVEQNVAKITNTSDNLNLNFKPTSKVGINMSLQTNIYESETDVTTNNSVTLNSSQVLSEKLSVGETLSYYTMDSSTNNTEDKLVALNSTYTTPVFQQSVFSLRGLTSGLFSSGNEALNNGTTYTYDLTAGMENKFDNLNSVLNYNINYYEKISTLDPEEQKIRIDESFVTKFIYGINYMSTADFTIRNTYPIESTEEDTVEKVLNIYNGITTSQDLDVRGTLNANIGLKYSKRLKTNEESFSTVSPDGTASLSYRIWRTLVYRGVLNANRDTNSAVTNYRVSNELLYRFRKLIIELGLNYNKQSGGETGDTSATDFKFNFKRSF